jgi:hypothetical protein
MVDQLNNLARGEPALELDTKGTLGGQVPG